MSDFEVITRLFIAIEAGERSEHNCVCDFVEAISAPWEDKNALAWKLQKAGLIEGLEREDYEERYFWCSRVSITLPGLEYVASTEYIQEEIEKMWTGDAKFPKNLASELGRAVSCLTK